MPYVPPEIRRVIDEPLNRLIIALEALPDKKEGSANYCVSRLVASVLEPSTGWSYGSLSKAIAVLNDAASEMRRRLMDPYEDLCIAKNGDIKEYLNDSTS